MSISRESTARLRLVPAVGVVWVTAFFATTIGAASVLAVAGWALLIAVLIVVVAARCRRPLARQLVLAAAVAVAAGAATASHVAFTMPARNELARVAVDGGRALEVTATVVGKVERQFDGALAFDAQVTRVAAGPRAFTISGPAVIRVDPGEVAGGDGLDVGARIVASGSAARADAGERHVIEVNVTRGVVVADPPDGVLNSIAALRNRLVASTEGLPGPGAGLIPGLAVGDTSEVDPSLDEAMKRSSLSHLTAVSGANCALVVGVAFWVAAALGFGRRSRVAIGLAVLVGFVLLVTPEPSVVRAATMAAIAMFGILLGRTGIGMSVLCLAVVALLVVDPWLAGSLGFALSTAATGSLLLIARPLAANLARWMPRSLALLLSVPLAAQLACGPLIVLIEPSVPVYGILANLIVAPAAPLSTIIGLLACLSAPLPLLQSGLAAVAWLPATWIAVTAETTVTLPGDLIPWVEGWQGALLLAAIGGCVVLVLGLRSTKSLPRRLARAGAAFILATVVGVSAGNAANRSFAGGWVLPPDWSILACDVGQGDALLIRSAGAVALIDTGPEPDRLDACLTRTGITHVDLLVLTHFDLDHVGGADAVMGRVDTLLHSPAVEEADAVLLREFSTEGATLVLGQEGMQGRLGEAVWSVRWPPVPSKAFPSGNDASIVIDVRGGGVPSSLLLGDLSAAPQRALVASGALFPRYTVVKVAHHGSADQHPALYARVAPAVALITVGADNDYGHPRREILDVLDVIGSTTARTDVNGVIALSLRGDDVVVWRERQD